MEEVKRGRGRPTVGERIPLGLRVTPELKQRLDAAAELSGRSQSQEAEFRLEHSFDREDLLFDVLRIAYGSKKIADLIMTVGAVFLVAGRAVASDNKIRDRLKSRDWTSDPAVCDIAIEAAHTVLESFRPAGHIPWLNAGLGALTANNFIKSIRHDSGNPAAEQMREILPATLRERLEAIAQRLRRPVEPIKSSQPQKKESEGPKNQEALVPTLVDAVEEYRRRA
jgi:hypothetical protein